MSRRGLSLIEVVASLLLIATTAAALLVAHGRSLAQLGDIRTQETAATLARELVTQWKLDPPEPAAEMHGRVETQPTWRWTRTAKPYGDAMPPPLWEVTLTIHRPGDGGSDHMIKTLTWLERSSER